MSTEPSLVFATSNYQYLKEEFIKDDAYESGELIRKDFPDQEHYHRFISDVKQRKVILIGGTINDYDTLELYDLACGLVGYGARQLNIIIPYFGYATMERAVKYGEIVKAKTRARMLSSIPPAHEGNRVFLLDLHAEGIPYYFEGNCRPFHVYAKDVILDMAAEKGQGDFVLASTDAGRAKWVASLAYDLGVDAAFVYKRRVSGSDTSVTGVNADVEGRRVVIYDDMIRTGGSLINAAKTYHDKGASEIHVIATHGLFPNDAVERIVSQDFIKSLGVTNSHPNVYEYQHPKYYVSSISNVLIDKLKEFSS